MQSRQSIPCQTQFEREKCDGRKLNGRTPSLSPPCLSLLFPPPRRRCILARPVTPTSDSASFHHPKSGGRRVASEWENAIGLPRRSLPASPCLIPVPGASFHEISSRRREASGRRRPFSAGRTPSCSDAVSLAQSSGRSFWQSSPCFVPNPTPSFQDISSAHTSLALFSNYAAPTRRRDVSLRREQSQGGSSTPNHGSKIELPGDKLLTRRARRPFCSGGTPSGHDVGHLFIPFPSRPHLPRSIFQEKLPGQCTSPALASPIRH